jgi:T5orf172 domain-containing protein
VGANRIYAYTVVGKDAEPWERISGQSRTTGTGLIKVGQTTKRTARERIKQQLGTAYPNLDGVKILLDEPAVREDGSEFTDHEAHAALVGEGIRRPEGEWFEATLDEVKAALNKVRSGVPFEPTRTESFPMRPEQKEAVEHTAGYFRGHAANDTHPPKFLWNAKMRFGKTFASYQLAREMGWTRVLILTYKPAVQAAWRDDLLGHVDFAGWHFVDRETPIAVADELLSGPEPVVRFASFQDLNQKSQDGQVKAHNESIHLTDWDCIVLDEYHFGAWRDSARELYDPADSLLAEEVEPDEEVTEEDLGLESAHYLYLSGTPFRAITNGEFTEDATFDWTYVDEQAAKESWANQDDNPYLELPKMEMYAYEIAPGAAGWAEDGEFSSFSLTEYFKAERIGPARGTPEPGDCVFEDPERVSEFLEMLRGKLSEQLKVQIISGQKPPFPYESPAFTEQVRHAVWYMPDVASCFAMRDMLDTHPYFSGFEIVVAAGSGAGQGAEAKPPVEAAIANSEKEHTSGSITLSCGKLMTGVTVREWGAILMLRSLKSPESYFQAAFRVQSPYAIRDPEGGIEVRKPTCYLFEFDPNRALSLLSEYGLRLAAQQGETPEQAIGKLINYLPIFGFKGGAMSPLEASDVLDWATAGVGATALAKQWNSPVLVDVNERTLSAVLDHPELVETLAQIEDFRALVNNGEHVITSTKMLKKAKREQGGQLDPEQKREQSETAKKRREIREKLQKFLARVPVFMYGTDFREEALKHVIESLDPALFERVTGLTIEDFRLLSDLGLFNAKNMDAAIWQFRQFERASLRYADTEATDDEQGRLGLWERKVDE